MLSLISAPYLPFAPPRPSGYPKRHEWEFPHDPLGLQTIGLAGCPKSEIVEPSIPSRHSAPAMQLHFFHKESQDLNLFHAAIL